jgi:hypothetical protein
MSGKAVSALVFGLLSVLFGYLLFSSIDPGSVRFVSPSKAHLTSIDRFLPLAALTTVCVIIAVSNLLSLRSKVADSEPGDSPAPPSPAPDWVCPGCGETNPGTFGECWHCQRLRTIGS